MPYHSLTEKGNPEAGYPKIIIDEIIIPDKVIYHLDRSQAWHYDNDCPDYNRTHSMTVASNHGYYELGDREDLD